MASGITYLFLSLLIIIVFSTFSTSLPVRNIESCERNLVYYCVSGDENYIQLFDMALKSLALFLPKNVDVLVLTQESFRHRIEQIVSEVQAQYPIQNMNVDIRVLDQPHVNPYTLRLYIFNVYEKIHEYHKVLYLDTDTLITNNGLLDLFQTQCSKSVFYVFKEADWYDVPFTIVQLHEDLERDLISNKLYPFNSGTMLFVASPDMQTHFNNVIWLHSYYPMTPTDQEYLNYYFNVMKRMTDSSILQRFVKLVHSSSTTTLDQHQATILHFYCNMGEGDKKFSSMNSIFQTLTRYELKNKKVNMFN